MSKHTVIVFTQTTCQPCQEFKKQLQNMNIEFIEKDILSDKKAEKEFFENGFLFTPSCIVEVNDGTHKIEGGNYKKIGKLLQQKVSI